MDTLKVLAGAVTRVVQTGRVSDYFAITFLTMALALGGAIALRGLPSLDPGIGPVSWIDLALVALLLAGAALTASTTSRIAAVAGLGVVGIGVALIFIVFGAPDVAITQLMVEVLVVVLVSVVMLGLPRLDDRPRPFRPGHAALSVGLGALVTVVLMAVLARPLDRRLSDYFEAASWPDAFGRNIVNVILVDFRALDTFGEVAVVVVAALSAVAVLTSGRRRSQK